MTAPPCFPVAPVMRIDLDMIEAVNGFFIGDAVVLMFPVHDVRAMYRFIRDGWLLAPNRLAFVIISRG